jgi:hypothetical protein
MAKYRNFAFFLYKTCVYNFFFVILRRILKIYIIRIMTALQLNADIYRNLGIIAEDETMLDKVAKYLRRVVKQATNEANEGACMATETITPALRRRINAARKEYAEGKTITCRTPQEMQQFFDSL